MLDRNLHRLSIKHFADHRWYADCRLGIDAIVSSVNIVPAITTANTIDIHSLLIFRQVWSNYDVEMDCSSNTDINFLSLSFVTCNLNLDSLLSVTAEKVTHRSAKEVLVQTG
jgi:hypothetical protein